METSTSSGRNRYHNVNIEISADPRQLFAWQHINNTAATNGSLEQHHACRRSDNIADDRGAQAEGIVFHGCDHGIGMLAVHNSDENTFIGDIERVKPQETAGTLHLGRDGESLFLDLDALS